MENGVTRNLFTYYYDEKDSGDLLLGYTQLSIEELGEHESKIQEITGSPVACWLTAKPKFSEALDLAGLSLLAATEDSQTGFMAGTQWIPVDIQEVRAAVRQAHQEIPVEASLDSSKEDAAMNIYVVSFKYNDDVYCTNLAEADSEEAVRQHYAKYEDVSIKPAEQWEIDSYKKRGMPMINCNSAKKERPKSEFNQKVEGVLSTLSEAYSIPVDKLKKQITSKLDGKLVLQVMGDDLPVEKFEEFSQLAYKLGREAGLNMATEAKPIRQAGSGPWVKITFNSSRVLNSSMDYNSFESYLRETAMDALLDWESDASSANQVAAKVTDYDPAWCAEEPTPALDFLRNKVIDAMVESARQTLLFNYNESTELDSSRLNSATDEGELVTRNSPAYRMELIDRLDDFYEAEEDRFLDAVEYVAHMSRDEFEQIDDSDPKEGFFKYFTTSVLEKLLQFLNEAYGTEKPVTLELTLKEYEMLVETLRYGCKSTHKPFDQMVIDTLARKVYRLYDEFHAD